MTGWLDFLGTEPVAQVEWSGVAVAGFSPRLLGRGRELASQLGCTLTALLPDEAKAKDAISLGADRAVIGDLEAAVRSAKPEIVLSESSALFPLAHALRTGCARAKEVDLDVSTRQLVLRVAAYADKMTFEYVSDARPQFAVVSVEALSDPTPAPSRTGEILPA